MSRIFLSHSSVDNAHAIALRDWLVAEGWNDLFLDLDPERGIAAGERWERALNEAASRCEAVLFLVSKAWLASSWCMKELNLAHRLNKRLFGVLIEEIRVGELPAEVTNTWQLVRLASGRDHQVIRIALPVTGEEVHVTFSLEGLARLKSGLQRAGLHASYFNWPPEHDPNRAPYRGLRPLEADDAGIFFGREAPVIKAIDQLRGLRETAPPRLFVILGASGAGKSSFLRAGLFPRLARDDQHFLPLPITRPERAALYGDTGLLAALTAAYEAAKITTPRADLRAAIQGGATALRPYLQTLVEKAAAVALGDETRPRPPTLVLSIDQGEELFLAEAQEEGQPFLALLRELATADAPSMIAVFSIRSDNYERLQESRELESVQKVPFDLGPMPKGSYAEVIKGPVRRLDGTARALRIDDELVDALLSDIEAGGAKDALPLLAFTLERLYSEYHAGGQLKVEHYEQLGRVKGSIEAAVERAFKAADLDPKIPKDREARLVLLRRGLIPWLAGIDPDTGAPRRRVARLSEIPAEARPLINQLVEQRLLATDVAKDTGETTIEPAHEALLRQWGLLQGWLKEDAGLLTILDGIKRASRDWSANNKTPSWLAHSEERLQVAQRLLARPDLAANLEPTDKDYISACAAAQRAAQSARRRGKALVSALALMLAAGGVSWWQERWLRDKYQWHMVMGPEALTPKKEKEKAAQPKAEFKECRNGCPLMVVVPTGALIMGSPQGEGGDDERPQHKVTIPKPFAVGKFEVTNAEWDVCVAAGACPRASDSTWGRDFRPVINVSWDDAKQYVVWLSRLTGQDYRLLTEAEWEYAARAGNPGRFAFGDDEAQLSEYAWFAENTDRKTEPVGKKKANALGLHDLHGNVREWVEDCWNNNYNEKPEVLRATGGAWTDGDCSLRVFRGGSWGSFPVILRSAGRDRGTTVYRFDYVGFRVARTLTP